MRGGNVGYSPDDIIGCGDDREMFFCDACKRETLTDQCRNIVYVMGYTYVSKKTIEILSIFTTIVVILVSFYMANFMK